MLKFKLTHYFSMATFFICLFIPSIKVNAMEIGKETTRYIVHVSARQCAFTLYLNDLEVFSEHSGMPVSTGVSIGEYLKPKDNVLKLDVWDPEQKEGFWREGAKCEAYIEAFDPVKKLEAETLVKLYFYPSHEPDLTKPESLFDNFEPIKTRLGESRVSPRISYVSQTQHYNISRMFDTHERFIEWMWYKSPVLSEPVTKEQMQELQAAYQRFWQALTNQDINMVRKLYHEMVFESAMANGSKENDYFDSIDFQELFEDEEFKDFAFIPLNFNDKKLIYSLDNKVVSLEPTPLLFCHKNNPEPNLDKDPCVELNPRFRFDGKEFIISR